MSVQPKMEHCIYSLHMHINTYIHPFIHPSSHTLIVMINTYTCRWSWLITTFFPQSHWPSIYISNELFTSKNNDIHWNKNAVYWNWSWHEVSKCLRFLDQNLYMRDNKMCSEDLASPDSQETRMLWGRAGMGSRKTRLAINEEKLWK